MFTGTFQSFVLNHQRFPLSSHCARSYLAEDFVDQAQQAVSTIWDMVTKAREWVAKVSDVLNPGSDPRKVNGETAATVADLQKLLAEANGLNVRVAEAGEVARVINAALEWQSKVDELLSSIQAPIRTKAGRSNCVQLSTLCSVLEEAELIPVHLEQRLELQNRVQSEFFYRARGVGPLLSTWCCHLEPNVFDKCSSALILAILR